MADEEIIVRINYDVDEARANIRSLTEEIERERAEQKKLKDQLKKGEISVNEYSEAVAISRDRMQQANTSRRQSIRLLNSEAGSIKQLQAKVARLTREKNSLNSTTEEGRRQIADYNRQIDGLNATIDEHSSVQERQRRNIGNYSSALDGLGGAFGGVTGSIKKATMALKAFIATPIGLILGVIAGLVSSLASYFKSSEEGQNAWNKVTKVASAVFGVFADALSAVGKFIYENITNGEKLRETWEGIKDWFDKVFTFEEQFELVASQFGRFTSWMNTQYQKFKGIFTENDEEIQKAIQGQEDANKRAEKATRDYIKATEVSQKTLIDTYNSVADAISDSMDKAEKQAEQAEILADRQAKLDKIERQNTVTKAKNAQKIADLILLSRQETATYDERMNAILESQKIKEKELALDEFIAKERLALRRMENSWSNSTKEDLEEEARLEAELYQVQKLNADQRRELINRETELNNKIKAKEKKHKDADAKAQKEETDRRTKAIEDLVGLEQERLLNEAKSIEDRRDLQIKAETDEFKRKINNDELLYEEKELLKAEHENRIAEIENEFEESKTEKEIEKRAMFVKSLAELESVIGESENRRLSIITSSFSKISDINFSEIKSTQDKIDAIVSATKGLTGLIVAGHQKQLDSFNKQKDDELAKAGDNEEKRAAIEKRFATKYAKLQEKQAKQEKAKAIIDATIATALAVTKAIAANPIPPFPFAIAAGALGAFQVASIASQPIPDFSGAETFEEGGAILGGKPHSLGGTKFIGSDGSMFEAEKGEAMFVLKESATAQIGALSAINEAYGGRSFFSGGKTHLAEGGKVSNADIQREVQKTLQNTPIVVRVEDVVTGFTDFENVKKVGTI